MPNEAKVKIPNYPADMLAALIADYNGGKGLNVDELAVKYSNWNGKGKVLNGRSVRSKLVFEKVYVPAETVASKPLKDEGPSKKELIEVLRKMEIFDEDALNGLGSATKSAIAAVIDAVTPTGEVSDEQVAA